MKKAVSTSSATVTTGFSVGGLIAALLSWQLNKSIIWALFHFLIGWLYVFYAACARTEEVEQVIHNVTG